MSDFKMYKNLAVVLLFSLFFLAFREIKKTGHGTSSTIKITFKNTVNNSSIVLNDSIYTNPFEEKYSITKLRYYITNVSVNGEEKNNTREENSYHLIDESEEASQSFSFNIPAGNYSSLNFLLGVDSLHNVSGAQAGDLDPAKDMFWTWNSGYVMAKMEGNSPSSKQVNNKYEFHVGGYAGPFNVIKKMNLAFSDSKPVHLEAAKTTEIIINADIDTWWKGVNDIKIAEHAVITTPGKMALAISDNYAKMFSIEKIISE